MKAFPSSTSAVSSVLRSPPFVSSIRTSPRAVVGVACSLRRQGPLARLGHLGMQHASVRAGSSDGLMACSCGGSTAEAGMIALRGPKSFVLCITLGLDTCVTACVFSASNSSIVLEMASVSRLSDRRVHLSVPLRRQRDPSAVTHPICYPATYRPDLHAGLFGVNSRRTQIPRLGPTPFVI